MTIPVLSLLYALSLALVIVPGSILGSLARGLMILASLITLAGLSSSGWRVKWVELRWAGLCALYIFAGIFSAIFSPRPEAGFLDAGRQAFIAVMSVAMMIYLRKPENSQTYRHLLTLPALFGAATLIGGFLLVMGFPTPEKIADLAAFKFEMDERFGVNPNPLSFAVLLVFVLSWRERGKMRPWWFIPYVCAVLLSIMLSGARTSLVVLAGAAALAWLLRRPPSRALVFVGVLVVLIGVITASTLLGDQDLAETLYWLSDITTGRSELWGAALAKFAERPLLGWGAFTWDMDLPQYLTLYSSDMGRFEGLASGAFHNAYLTQLAEKGLLGLGLEILILAYVLRASLLLHWGRNWLSGEDRRIANIAPTWSLLLVLRGFSEQGGLLGYANAGVDFIAYAGVALILSTYIRFEIAHATEATK